jgi:hypothetical protein
MSVDVVMEVERKGKVENVGDVGMGISTSATNVSADSSSLNTRDLKPDQVTSNPKENLELTDISEALVTSVINDLEGKYGC